VLVTCGCHISGGSPGELSVLYILFTGAAVREGSGLAGANIGVSTELVPGLAW